MKTKYTMIILFIYKLLIYFLIFLYYLFYQIYYLINLNELMQYYFLKYLINPIYIFNNIFNYILINIYNTILIEYFYVFNTNLIYLILI